MHMSFFANVRECHVEVPPKTKEKKNLTLMF